MPRRIITEEELREAAREVLEYELAIFDSYNDYPDHIFHGKFRLDMAALIHEVKRGAVKAAKYSMGFTFYAKQCIAAVLILFTLSCIAMPETVLAGYHKLIEVIETVFEDYTEYRYRVNDDGGIEETFKPLKLGYLPEGMELIEKNDRANCINLVYCDKQYNYLKFQQKKIEVTKYNVYVIDSENKLNEHLRLKNGEINIFSEEGTILYTGIYGNYEVVGITNLSKEELINILEKIKV